MEKILSAISPPGKWPPSPCRKRLSAVAAIAAILLALAMSGCQTVPTPPAPAWPAAMSSEENGIAHYRAGNLEKALADLMLAVNREPTARARFYLDRTRRALPQGAGGRSAPPEIRLAMGAAERRTADDPVAIAGEAVDPAFVSAVSVNGESIFMEGAAERVSFSRKLRLRQGRHEISVTALNLMGGIVRRNQTIYVDRDGPVATLMEMSPSDDSIWLRLHLWDPSGLGGLRINDAPFPLAGSREGNGAGGAGMIFAEYIPASPDPLRIVVSDTLGNATHARIPVVEYLDPSARPDAAAIPKPFFGTPRGLGRQSPEARQSEGRQPPNAAPEIRIGGLTENQETYQDQARFSGWVRDDRGMADLAVNGRSILGPSRGAMIFFSHGEILEPGPNPIVLTARNAYGRSSTLSIGVHRVLPDVRRAAARLGVAVLPFTAMASTATAAPLDFEMGPARSLQLDLIRALRQQDRFRLIDPMSMDRSGRRPAATDLSPAAAVGADAILRGEIRPMPDGLSITARLVDAETGQILAARAAFDDNRSPSALSTLADHLAAGLAQDFPLKAGRVMMVEGNDILTDLGSGETALHRRLILYREEPVRHPVTGASLGARTVILGRARVTEVLPDMSRARLARGEAGTIRIGDRAIPE